MRHSRRDVVKLGPGATRGCLPDEALRPRTVDFYDALPEPTNG